MGIEIDTGDGGVYILNDVRFVPKFIKKLISHELIYFILYK